MFRREFPVLKAGLSVVVSLFLLSACCGPGGTEVCRQNSNHHVIHLAVGTFDPCRESGPIALPKALRLSKYPKGERGYYIVQFRGPVLQKWKDDVVSAGALLFDYIPQFAFIARMDDTGREAVRSIPSVRWVGIYQPGYRMAPDLLNAISEKNDRPADVLVTVFPGEDVSRLVAELKSLGGEILEVSEIHNRIQVQVSVSRISEVARLTGIKWVERTPDIELFPSVKGRFKE